MFEILYPPPNEKVVLCGLRTAGADATLFEEDMQEMTMLCRTAGADVEEIIIQNRERPVASTYLGSGKLREIRAVLRSKGCSTLVIDADLSPGQVRSIENMTGGKVIDRSQLILDIFAQHARTNESRIQVELAQLRTLYPRLTHAWTHLSQQVGGIGTRGPGEKQLEVDRRLVQRKIADLKAKLKKIERSRLTQRKSRKDFYNIALVGYTNVGKSSLLNALCGSDVLVENRLFATLDTATRRTYIPDAGTVVISDTVGFIRKLPHHLVASFRSTLEVVADADLLIIVMDASSRWSAQEFETVIAVVHQLGGEAVARIVVFNKSDLFTDPFERKKRGIAFPDALFVSAFCPQDMQRIKTHITGYVLEYRREKAMAELVMQKTRASIAKI